ncbi:transcriptional regulator [Streptomyces sp. CB01201]|uniref:ArsR/SmtB family transcription factor n=1 Tax=Streptomyces sp. CB01201 TaxID=2020324 RepID=UPI000C27ACED|nr:helix-turn-helix domain-containing protein [Streptomyces sp. CB01201]PJN02694.1 transcriptional regulator [Streptomyces sp. CB01201]
MAQTPRPIEITELAALKALAQPRRQRILQQLTLGGPATAAILARGLGLNTGATSYHLRELARYGFVEDAAGQSPRGERWWRAIPADRRFPPRSRQTPQTRPVLDELNRHAYAADLELFERLQRASTTDDFAYSRSELTITEAELGAFFEEYIALLNRYKRTPDQAPPGARTVHTRLMAFPAPPNPEDAS